MTKILTDYARKHGTTEKAFIDAGWVETTYSGYPALKFATTGGDRFRIFGGDNKYAGKSKRVWYKLAEAIELATDMPLILVNGEASTVAGQANGLPTTCVTMGEKKLPQELIAELKQAYTMPQIFIAFDNDIQGRQATQIVAEQLHNEGFAVNYVEWPQGLEEKFDFADYLKEYGAKATADFVLAGRAFTPTRKPEAPAASTRAVEAPDTKQAEVIQLLEALAPDRADTYDTWIEVGIICKNELGEEGFEVWNTWSKLSDKYDTTVAESKWKSFKGGHDKKLGIGTLVRMVKEDNNGINPIVKSSTEKAIVINDGTSFKIPQESKITRKEYAALLYQLGYSFRYNDMNDEIEVNGESLTERKSMQYYGALLDLGFKNRNDIDLAVSYTAEENHYHPIKEYLKGLEWDGRDHIGKVAQALQGDDMNTNSTFFRRWLISVIAKSIDEKQNLMLVLAGPQGIGKSTFAAWLSSGIGKQYYLDQKLNLEDKDTYLRAVSTWIWEVGELGATTRKVDHEALKQFITQQKVRVRRAYERKDTVKPVTASYIGTVNDDGAGFLVDPTGNRRFIVLDLNRIDFAYQEVDINQMWAQAVALYNAGEAYELTADEKSLQSAVNSKFEHISPIEDVLRDAYTVDPKAKTYTKDIVDFITGLSSSYGNANAVSQQVSKVLTKMGAKRDQDRKTGLRYWTVKRHVSGFGA